MNHTERYCRTIKRMCKRVGRLPSDYTQVAYIQTPSTNNFQYRPYLIIDYYPNALTEYDVQMSFCIWESIKVLFGLYEVNGYKFNVQSKTKEAQTIHLNSGSTLELNIGRSPYLNLRTNGYTAINNGIAYNIDKSSVAGTHKLAIFTCYSSGSNNYTFFASAATFNHLTIYENNNTVIDIIPVVRKSDNVAGGFDLINQKFYTNVGTGDFIAGASV